MFVKTNIKTLLKQYINEQLLNEGSSDILYHFTSSHNLLNILKTNEISLTAAIGSKSDLDINRKKFFFFSTTRSKKSGYTRGEVKIVLDGRKLGDNYKIIPVDYWRYPKKPSDWETKADYIRSMKSSEQEDRIISDKSTIPNAKKYIKGIHFLINEYTISEIIRYCEMYDIPLYVYKRREDWLNQVNSIDIREYRDKKQESNNDSYFYDRFNYDVAALISYNDEENFNKIANYLKDDDKINKLKQTLDHRTRNNFNIHSPYSFEVLDIIGSDIHNMRSKTDENSKFLINLLARDMKKNNTFTLKDYLTKKQWRGTLTVNKNLRKSL